CRSADGPGTRLSVAAAVRVFPHQHATITTWLTRAGMHSATLHERLFQNLTLPHLQLDELRTRLRSRVHALWLWVVIDPLTKIIPVLHLGTRTQDAAHAVVHELHGRLAPACLPVFTSDGLNHYFYALTAHFGQWVASVGRRARRWQVAVGLIYGQVKKREKAAAAGRGHVHAAVWDARSTPVGPARTGLEGQAHSGLCRAGQSDAAAKRGGPHPPELVDVAGGAAASGASGVVAGLLSLCAAT